MQPSAAPHPIYSLASSVLPHHIAASHSWQSTNGSAAQPLPSSPGQHGFQGSMAQPWLSSPDWQSQNGNSTQAWPDSPQWATSAPDQHMFSSANTKHHNSVPTTPQMPAGIWGSYNGMGHSPLPASQAKSAQQGSLLLSDSSQQAVHEQPLGGSDDEDGFGDFASAEHEHVSRPDHLQPAQQAVSQAADRWALAHSHS